MKGGIFIVTNNNLDGLKSGDNADIPKETRLESYEKITPVAEIRKKMILNILRTHGEMTAQELAVELHKHGYIPSDERNFTAPRLTELRKDGKVKPTGKKQCDKTGRTVTIWAVVNEADEAAHKNDAETKKPKLDIDPVMVEQYKKEIKAGFN